MYNRYFDSMIHEHNIAVSHGVSDSTAGQRGIIYTQPRLTN